MNFVGTLGFSIVLPFLVYLVTMWGGNALVFGLMGATYSAFQLVGAPILGRWSDIFGRRKILLLSQVGTLLSWGIFLAAFFLPVYTLREIDSPYLGQFTLTLPLLVVFLARAMDGITGGNVSVANAYLADISTAKTRTANFGKMALSGNLGFIIGPALAGLLGATIMGEMLPVIAALLISLVATLLIAFGLRETRLASPKNIPQPCKLRKTFGQEHKECYRLEGQGKTGVRVIFSRPDIPALMGINFLVMLGFSFFYISFPINAVQGLGWSIIQTGTFLAILSLMMVVVQGPILARVSKICAARTLAILGSLVLAGGFALFVSGNEIVLYGGALLVAIGNGLMWPSVMALVAERAGEGFQGAVQGFAGSSGAVASIVGLAGGGLLFEVIGPSEFFVAGAIIGLVSIIGLSLRK